MDLHYYLRTKLGDQSLMLIFMSWAPTQPYPACHMSMLLHIPVVGLQTTG